MINVKRRTLLGGIAVIIVALAVVGVVVYYQGRGWHVCGPSARIIRTGGLLSYIEGYHEKFGHFPDTKKLGVVMYRKTRDRDQFISGAFETNDAGRIVDLWGMPYRVNIQSNRVSVTSAGPDGEFGTRDDAKSEKEVRK